MKKILKLAALFERKLAQYPNNVPNVTSLIPDALDFSIYTIQNFNLNNPLTEGEKKDLEEADKRLKAADSIRLIDIAAALKSTNVNKQKQYLKDGPPITTNEINALGLSLEGEGTQMEGKCALDKLLKLRNSFTGKINISNST